MAPLQSREVMQNTPKRPCDMKGEDHVTDRKANKANVQQLASTRASLTTLISHMTVIFYVVAVPGDS